MRKANLTEKLRIEREEIVKKIMCEFFEKDRDKFFELKEYKEFLNKHDTQYSYKPIYVIKAIKEKTFEIENDLYKYLYKILTHGDKYLKVDNDYFFEIVRTFMEIIKTKNGFEKFVKYYGKYIERKSKEQK